MSAQSILLIAPSETSTAIERTDYRRPRRPGCADRGAQCGLLMADKHRRAELRAGSKAPTPTALMAPGARPGWVYLNWRHHDGGDPLPCWHCCVVAVSRDEKGRPMHKDCAADLLNGSIIALAGIGSGVATTWLSLRNARQVSRREQLGGARQSCMKTAHARA